MRESKAILLITAVPLSAAEYEVLRYCKANMLLVAQPVSIVELSRRQRGAE